MWWKRCIDVQLPYRWKLRRLEPGFVLEIGSGLGRNLLNLDGNGIGIDHNPSSVSHCQARGIRAFSPADFAASTWAKARTFDSILLSHVAEHMTRPEVVDLLRSHLPFLKENGRLILITPQEKGFVADRTHVEFMDEAALRWILAQLGFEPIEISSFPLPRRPFGKLFRYNEFVAVGRRQV